MIGCEGLYNLERKPGGSERDPYKLIRCKWLSWEEKKKKDYNHILVKTINVVKQSNGTCGSHNFMIQDIQKRADELQWLNARVTFAF